MTDEQAFQKRADAALEELYRVLSDASEKRDFEADFNGGALTVEFEEPRAKFVVSPNSPVRQIWVSAHSKSFKLDWDETRGAFVLAESGQSLRQVMAEQVGKQLGEEIAL
jgi:CyaY protein